MHLYLAVLALLVALAPTLTYQECNPINSTANPSVRTQNNGTCFFPFIFNGTLYNDCAKYTETSSEKWCATSCNFESHRKFDSCLWTLKDTGIESCKNLTSYNESNEVVTVTGRKCVFPFIYKGKCYNDCVYDSYYFCPHNPSYELNDDFSRCISIKANLAKKECSDLKSSKLSYLPETNKGFDQCVFPFYYAGGDKCVDECLTQGSLSYWCSNTTYFDHGSKFFAECKYLRKIPEYTNFIEHGIYKMSLNCTDQQKELNKNCGRYLKSSDNTNIFLADLNQSFHRLELIPQPKDSLIIVLSGPDSGTKYILSKPSSKSIYMEFKPMLNYMENCRWILTASTSSNASFTLSAVKAEFKPDENMYLGVTDSHRLIYSPIKFFWQFHYLSKVERISTVMPTSSIISTKSEPVKSSEPLKIKSTKFHTRNNAQPIND